MRLFVGNLSFHTTEGSLEEAFQQFGSVKDCKIMMDRATNRSRGFGFVTMENQESGEASIRGLDGQELDGRPIKVNEARPREEFGSGGGGGGGGGGNRGGGGGRGDRSGGGGGGGGGRPFQKNRW